MKAPAEVKNNPSTGNGLGNKHYLEIRDYVAQKGGVPPKLYDADRTIRGSANWSVVYLNPEK